MVVGLLLCFAWASLDPSLCKGFFSAGNHRISGLVVEYIVAIDVTRIRFPADAYSTPAPNF